MALDSTQSHPNKKNIYFINIILILPFWFCYCCFVVLFWRNLKVRTKIFPPHPSLPPSPFSLPSHFDKSGQESSQLLTKNLLLSLLNKPQESLHNQKKSHILPIFVFGFVLFREALKRINQKKKKKKKKKEKERRERKRKRPHNPEKSNFCGHLGWALFFFFSGLINANAIFQWSTGDGR